ncbi:PAS domain S-box protein [Sediminicurvatus halobius]|uniref:histidine kinase n=1 Tax=Sediminicurvatus halobius TaxID=2182432 RepID=A0A2U2MX22_9GAMM|nr:PAS domain S-box protein [Spiribacter halobius]PWG61407.1 hypothetical protein DEM34_16700 [Spiribacter halobius]UEX78533.1 PAS domain S-box protein [Spiribacter halobius]
MTTAGGGEADATWLLAVAGRVARIGGWRVELGESVVRWSDEVAAIHGSAPGAWPTLDEAFTFYRPGSRERIEQCFRACAETGTPYDEELELRRVDGTRVWVRAIGEAVRDVEGRIVAVQGALQDITERREAEALERRRARQRSEMLDILQEMAATHLEGRPLLERMAERCQRLFQADGAAVDRLEGEELVYQAATGIVAPHVGLRLPISGSLSGAAILANRQLVTRDADNDPRLDPAPFRAVGVRSLATSVLRVHGEALGTLKVMAAACDAFTETDAAQLQLLAEAFAALIQRREADARARGQAELLEQVQEAIVVKAMDGRVRYWNRGAARMYGYDPADAVGKDYGALVGPGPLDDPAGAAALRQGGDWRGRLHQQRRDGRPVVVEGHWSVVSDARGGERLLGVLTDITERLALEEQLRQSQRLEAVGQLTGGVAHDFNNLLTVILANAELLLDTIPPGSEGRESAEVITRAAERGGDLIQRLLTFARRQPLDPRAVDLNPLLEGLHGLLRRTLAANIALRLVPAPQPAVAWVDPHQLEAALLNICLNARDAMAEGGELLIEVQPDDGEGMLSVIVKDTGTGIDPADLERVFDPFFTTKAKGQGTGLGLSMVYGFVIQSGGRVSIDSRPEEGTCVTLTLPSAGGARPAPKMSAADEESTARGGERILLVEDDELVCQHVEILLRALGYEVVTAHNGPQALAKLEAGEAVDLLFTDVIMPGGMNGRELAAAAQRLRPDLPVLYSSGYPDGALGSDGRLEEGVALLPKPYRRAELAAKLREVLGRRAP